MLRPALRRARRSPGPRAFFPCAAEMFAQGNHGPHGSDIEAAEIRHVVRGLSHHPSVAICESIKTNPEPHPRRRTLTVNFNTRDNTAIRTT